MKKGTFVVKLTAWVDSARAHMPALNSFMASARKVKELSDSEVEEKVEIALKLKPLVRFPELSGFISEYNDDVMKFIGDIESVKAKVASNSGEMCIVIDTDDLVTRLQPITPLSMKVWSSIDSLIDACGPNLEVALLSVPKPVDSVVKVKAANVLWSVFNVENGVVLKWCDLTNDGAMAFTKSSDYVDEKKEAAKEVDKPVVNAKIKKVDNKNNNSVAENKDNA